MNALEGIGGNSELYRRLSQWQSELERLEVQNKELKEILDDHLMFLNDPDLIVRNA